MARRPIQSPIINIFILLQIDSFTGPIRSLEQIFFIGVIEKL